MNTQPMAMGRSIPPGWTKISVSDWESNWHKQERAAKDAQVSKLVEIASITYDSETHYDLLSAHAFMQLGMLSQSDSLVFERWLPIAECRRQREFEKILAKRKERAIQETRARETRNPLPRDQKGGWVMMGEGLRYDDLALSAPSDLTFMTENPRFLGPPPPYYNAFEFACRKGPLATVQSIISSEACTTTPAFLHHGLCLALKAGNVVIAGYFLAAGAPIVRKTPEHILSAPVDQQIPLFALLYDHGWTPNTPGLWGTVLLPSVVTDHSLLRWFMGHGANPNLGDQQEYLYGESITNSCTVLEKAAYRGDVEAVSMLLDAGAVIQNGFPLHAAAGACPPGSNPHSGLVTPSKEFESSRIQVMALLVERGADINQYQGPQRGNMVAGYAIVMAAMAGAVERVRWLLEKGADPTKRGAWGSAVEYQAEVSYCEDQQPLSTGPSTPPHRRVIPRLIGILSIISCLWLTLYWLPIGFPKFKLFSCNHHDRPGYGGLSFDGQDASTNLAPADSERVPFEAHIMSKCPDARDCIRELVVPVMEKVSEKVDFELSFIASVSNKSSDVMCMHGPGECVGDMLMLCAANLPFPPGDSFATGRTPTVRYLGFATCLISSYAEIPDRTLVEQCALEHGIDFDALNKCVSRQDDNPNNGDSEDAPLSGVALLRESARHSADLGVKTSCTVRLDDTVWCVRDGGLWKDCAKKGEGRQVSVLVDEIEKLWGQRN
ncbi:hypothetical protein BJX76DRAFT_350835 [Aspergillus varians]